MAGVYGTGACPVCDYGGTFNYLDTNTLETETTCEVCGYYHAQHWRRDADQRPILDAEGLVQWEFNEWPGNGVIRRIYRDGRSEIQPLGPYRWVDLEARVEAMRANPDLDLARCYLTYSYAGSFWFAVGSPAVERSEYGAMADWVDLNADGRVTMRQESVLSLPCDADADAGADATAQTVDEAAHRHLVAAWQANRTKETPG
jgi:hypothetical protein